MAKCGKKAKNDKMTLTTVDEFSFHRLIPSEAMKIYLGLEFQFCQKQQSSHCPMPASIEWPMLSCVRKKEE